MPMGSSMSLVVSLGAVGPGSECRGGTAVAIAAAGLPRERELVQYVASAIGARVEQVEDKSKLFGLGQEIVCARSMATTLSGKREGVCRPRPRQDQRWLRVSVTG